MKTIAIRSFLLCLLVVPVAVVHGGNDNGGSHTVQSVQAWVKSPAYLSACRGEAFSYSLKAYAARDAKEIKFEAADLPKWLKLSPAGELSGNAGTGDLGVTTFKVSATWAKDPVVGEVHLSIVNCSLGEPITIYTGVGKALSSSLSLFLGEGKFEKVSGADVFGIDARGSLTGIPTERELGENHLTVKATHDDGTVDHFRVILIVR